MKTTALVLVLTLGASQPVASEDYNFANPWRTSLTSDTASAAGIETSAKNPLMASILSTASPALLLGAHLGFNYYLATQYRTLSDAVNQTVVLGFPLSFGAGYLYAGDPWRGLLVGLGGSAITVTGFSYLSTRGTPQASINHSVIVVPLMILGLVGYGWWVARDVWEVTNKVNDEATASE